MCNLEKQIKLANESIELIKEFREEASILGGNPLKSINIKIEDELISIEVDQEGEEIKDYAVSEISSVLFDDMDGWSDAFHEGISIANEELESYFKEHSKDEFKEYVGKLKYAEYRCEEIYTRLQEIEEEFSSIEDGEDTYIFNISDDSRFKVNISIGYVFQHKKIIIKIPSGSLVVSDESIHENLEMFNFGPVASLPCEAISIGEANKEVLVSTLREESSEAIVVIENVQHSKTGQVLEDITELANKICNQKNVYLEKGYKVVDVFEFNANVHRYIENIDIDKSAILNVKKENFNLKQLILDAQEKFGKINRNLFTTLRKSKIVNYIYLNEDSYESVDEMYNEIINDGKAIAVPYMYWDEENQDFIYTLQGDLGVNEVFQEYEYDEEPTNEELFGSCKMRPENVISYLITDNDDSIKFNVINYKGANQGCEMLYEVIEDGGDVLNKMTMYLEKFKH